MVSEIYKKYNYIIIAIFIIISIYMINYTENCAYKNNDMSNTITNYGIVKTARLSNSDSFIQENYTELEIKNSEKSKNKIEQEIKKIDGVIYRINSFNSVNKIGYSMIIKIPSGKVNDFMNNVIKPLGKVLNENFSIQNVGTQYNNNQDLIDNLVVRKNRLTKLLETSKKIDDIIKVDKELSSIQNQLDNLKRINDDLKNDIELTTININLKPKTFLSNTWSLNSSFYKALQNFIIFSQKLIDLTMHILLFVPYIIPIYFIYKFSKKNK